MLRRWTSTAVLLVAGVLLAACSDGDGGGATPTTRTTAPTSAPLTSAPSPTSAAPSPSGAPLTTEPVRGGDTTTTADTVGAAAAPSPTTSTRVAGTAPAPTAPAPTAPAPSPGTTTPAVASGRVTVFAAASLTNAFQDIGRAFEQANPGTSVSFNFAGSPTLVTQLFQGASADVFASADSENMARLVDSGLMRGTPRVFTRNLLQITVARGNPKSIAGLADLARADVVTVLCAPAVPCGAYAREALAKAGVSVSPRSNEANVRAVVGRVASGEADAGIAYVTDVLADARVEGIVIPDGQNVVAEYPLAVLQDAANPAAAEAFVAFVQGPQGQAVLGRYGFLPR